MSDLKHDATTAIEKAVTNFASDMTKAATELIKRIAEKKTGSEKAGTAHNGSNTKPMQVKFALDRDQIMGFRTPAQQAERVVAGYSWVCWGAHMADKARHATMSINGRVARDWRDLRRRVFHENFTGFKKEWAAKMVRNGLKNFAGRDGWNDDDPFHLELPHGKIAKTDERVQACLQEYV